MKKMKMTTNLSEEALKTPFSSKDLYYPKRKPILNVTPKSLYQQRIKRINVIGWNLCLERDMRRQKRVCKVLGQALKLNKNTQKLFLYFGDSLSILKLTDQDLLDLANSLKGLKSLQEITLTIKGCDGITDTGLYYLMKGFHRLSGLKEISLGFINGLKITDTSFKYISRSLKGMKFLESLFFEFRSFEQKITEKGIEKLNRSLNHLTRLEDITLDIPYCLGMTDLSLAGMSFQKVISLREISLFLAGCIELTDKGLGFLTQSFEGLPNLQGVSLDLWDCQFSDDGLLHIWKMMNNLPSLQFVNLVFSDCSEITDAAFSDLNEETLECLALVEEFHLEFYYCSEITDSGLIHLCKALKKFANLQSLSLCFADCAQMTDLGLKEIIGCMDELKYLENIKVDFAGNEKITGASLREISQFLEVQASVKRFTLLLSPESRITNREMNKFHSQIKKLKRKRPDLRINFFND